MSPSDQTAFGDAFKYHFTNFNLNKNPITTNFFNPSSLGVLGAWSFSPKLAIVGGVMDPYTKADRLDGKQGSKACPCPVRVPADAADTKGEVVMRRTKDWLFIVGHSFADVGIRIHSKLGKNICRFQLALS